MVLYRCDERIISPEKIPIMVGVPPPAGWAREGAGYLIPRLRPNMYVVYHFYDDFDTYIKPGFFDPLPDGGVSLINQAPSAIMENGEIYINGLNMNRLSVAAVMLIAERDQIGNSAFSDHNLCAPTLRETPDGGLPYNQPRTPSEGYGEMVLDCWMSRRVSGCDPMTYVNSQDGTVIQEVRPNFLSKAPSELPLLRNQGPPRDKEGNLILNYYSKPHSDQSGITLSPSIP